MRIAPLEKVIKTGQILVPLFLRSDPCKVPEITISCKVQEILINPVFNQFSRKFQDYQRVPCIILLCIMKAVGSSGGVQMVDTFYRYQI